MRISLLYRGEYSQWRERFMNYLEEQTDGEAMISSIQNGDQPLPVIAQVSLAGNAQNAPPTLKDLNWKCLIIRGIFVRDKMSRDVITVGSTMRISLLYRGEYSKWRKRFMNYLEEQTDGEAMINSIQNDDQPLPVIAQVQMRGSEYGEQDRKAAILYEYETFKAIEEEQFLDTYLCYLQQNQGDVNDALGYKKKAIVVTSDPLALVVEKIKVSKRKEKVVLSSDSKGSGRTFCQNCKQAKVKDYNYYKTKMLLAKNDSDEQVLLAEDQAWMESSSDSDQEINANMIADQEVLFDKMSVELVELDKHVGDLKNTVIEKDFKISELEEYLDTFSSVRRPKHSGVIWKKKGSSNTSNVDLSSVSLSKLNKNVKRYSRKDLLSCNNSHLRKTSSASVCNDDMNVSDCLDLSLDHRFGMFKSYDGFVEKFFGTVRFGNNDFTMIADYGDVVLDQ
nr:hypothetical protein [Tanacetum cinerariifolium]